LLPSESAVLVGAIYGRHNAPNIVQKTSIQNAVWNGARGPKRRSVRPPTAVSAAHHPRAPAATHANTQPNCRA
jgi:hypothetical protein